MQNTQAENGAALDLDAKVQAGSEKEAQGKLTTKEKAAQAKGKKEAEKRLSMNIGQRAEWEEKGVGVNAFATFVHRLNLLFSLVAWLASHYDEIKEAIRSAQGESVWHLTKGVQGWNAVACERYKGLTVGEGKERKTLDILWHVETEKVFCEKVASDTCVLTQDELLSLAEKKNNYKRFGVKTRMLDDKKRFIGWSDERLVSGIVLGGMANAEHRYAALVYRDNKGKLVSERLMVGNAKAHEMRQAYLAGDLTKEDKEKLANSILRGVQEAKAKDDAKNAEKLAKAAERKERAARVKAEKEAKAAQSAQEGAQEAQS